MKRKGKATKPPPRAAARPKRQRSNGDAARATSNLPAELWARILTLDNFAVGEFVGLRRVCRQWRDVVDRVDEVEHKIERAFQDDLTNFAPRDSKRRDPVLADVTVSVQGVFSIVHIRAMRAEWKDALDFGIRQTASVCGSTDEKKKQRYPGRRACQTFCANLDWDRVKRISLDLGDYEALFCDFEVMRDRPSTRRLPALLTTSLTKASNLKCLELLDANHTFLERGIIAYLSTKLERLELRAGTDYIIGPFVSGEPSRSLVRAVPSLRFIIDSYSIGVGHVLSDIFDATSDTVKDLEVHLDLLEDDLGDEVMQLDDGNDFGIVMNRLQVLNLKMDYYLDDAFPLLLSAPNLRKAIVTPEAADYLEMSSRSLFGRGLHELDVDIGMYTTIEPALSDLVHFWDSLAILCIHVDGFEGDEGELFDMSEFFSALAVHIRVPLKKLVITGGDKWNGKGLLALVESRNGPKVRLIEPQRLEEVTIYGHDFEPSLHDELAAAVPSFSWTPSKITPTKRPAPYLLRKRK